MSRSLKYVRMSLEDSKQFRKKLEFFREHFKPRDLRGDVVQDELLGLMAGLKI